MIDLFEITQIVGKGKFKRKIDFDKIVENTKFKFHWCEESPKLLGFWIEEPKVHLTVFQTGSFIVNGAKNTDIVYKGIRKIKREITRCKAWK